MVAELSESLRRSVGKAALSGMTHPQPGDLSPLSPVLRIERLTYTSDRRPLDFEYLHYRGDAFQYRLQLERGCAARDAFPGSMVNKQ